jgi:CheY-like chemotaxis protein
MDRVTVHEQRQRRISVLFVGSPPAELWNACDAFRADSVDFEVVRDGKAAIARLSDLADSPVDAGAPDLILIEFGFSSPDGSTVLHAIKSSPRLNAVPVVVIGATDDEAGATYEHGGNVHVTAPDTTDEYVDLMAAIGRFWFAWARYPAESLSVTGK